MENKADFRSIIDSAKTIITNPAGFYREMPKSGGYIAPLIFVVVMAVIVGILITLFSLFGLGIMGGMSFGLGSVIMATVFSVISSFIGAAILYVIWKLMGSTESYEVAYRCIAYASVTYPITAILGPIPFIGAVIGILIGTYLMVIASTEVHHLNKRNAWLVFGILGLLVILSNISNEMAARRMASQAEGFAEQFKGFTNQMGDPEDMTPEEAGRALGEFFKGMEDARKND